VKRTVTNTKPFSVIILEREPYCEIFATVFRFFTQKMEIYRFLVQKKQIQKRFSRFYSRFWIFVWIAVRYGKHFLKNWSRYGKQKTLRYDSVWFRTVRHKIRTPYLPILCFFQSYEQWLIIRISVKTTCIVFDFKDD